MTNTKSDEEKRRLDWHSGFEGGLYNRLRGDEKMCEALREIMAEDLKNAEILGEERGIEQGVTTHLVKLVIRKLSKGMQPSEIADILEEPEDNIREICKLASKYAPEYDVDKILEDLNQLKSAQTV